jgi:polyisoprenoid-binding protein YceI
MGTGHCVVSARRRARGLKLICLPSNEPLAHGVRLLLLVEQTSYVILPSNDSTLAVEIYKTGLMKRKKHLLFFEQFRGELCYFPHDPERSRVKMTIDAASLICRDKWLKLRKQEEVSRYARTQILAVDRYPHITFASDRIAAKRIRGYDVQGVLTVRDTARTVNLNLVVNQTKPETLQIDGDATFRLSQFEVPRPSSLFGLIGTKDEVLIRLLLWATRST